MKLDPSQDGIGHINIYSKGKTELGRFLSNFSDCNVDTDDGPFRTVEGYWYWLSIKDDRLRTTNGFDSKKLGRELKGADWLEDQQFKFKILKAICQKILSSEKYKKQLVKSINLPLVHYYVYNGKVIEPKNGLWIINFIDQLRNDL